MINIKNISIPSDQSYLKKGDWHKVISTGLNSKDTDVTVTTVTHDAYTISIIDTKIKDGVYYIKYYRNNKLLTKTFNEMLEDEMLIYPYNLIQDSLHSMGIYATDEKHTENKYLILLQKDILDIAIKLNISRADFLNNIVYPNVRILLENRFFNPEHPLSKDLKLEYLQDILLSNSITRIKTSTSPLLRRYLYAMLNDEFARYSSKNVDLYTYITQSKVLAVYKRVAKAIYHYEMTKSKAKLRELYNSLNNILGDLGLNMYILLNELERIINGVEVPHSVSSIREVFENYRDRIDETRSSFLKYYTNTYGESAKYESDVPASAQFSTYNSSYLNQEENLMTPLQPNVIDSIISHRTTAVDDRPEHIIDREEIPLDRTSVDRILYQGLRTRLDTLSSVKTFKNLEDKNNMIKTVIRFIKDVNSQKMSKVHGAKLDYIDKDAKEIDIYSVLIQDANIYLDYLDSIEYYGINKEVEQLNLDRFAKGEFFFRKKGVYQTVKHVDEETGKVTKEKQFVRGAKTKIDVNNMFEKMTDKEQAKLARQVALSIKYPKAGYLNTFMMEVNPFRILKKAKVSIADATGGFFQHMSVMLNSIIFVCTLGMVSFEGESYSNIDNLPIDYEAFSEYYNEISNDMTDSYGEGFKDFLGGIKDSVKVAWVKAKINVLYVSSMTVLKSWYGLVNLTKKNPSEEEIKLQKSLKEDASNVGKKLEELAKKVDQLIEVIKGTYSDKYTNRLNKLSDTLKNHPFKKFEKAKVAEALSFTSMNKLKTNEITPLNSKENVIDLSRKLTNTVKSNYKDNNVSQIDLVNKNSFIFGVVKLDTPVNDKDNIVFELSNGYNELIDNLTPFRINGTVTRVNKMNDEEFNNILRNVNVNPADNKQLREEIQKTDNPEVKKVLVKELEEKVLQKVDKMKGKKNEGEETETDR